MCYNHGTQRLLTQKKNNNPRSHYPLPHLLSLFLPPPYLLASRAKTKEVNKAKVLPLWSFHFVGAFILFLSWKPDFCHRTLAFESRRGTALLLRSILTPRRSEIPVESWPLKWMVQNSQAALRTKLWQIQVKPVFQLNTSTSGHSTCQCIYQFWRLELAVIGQKLTWQEVIHHIRSTSTFGEIFFFFCKRNWKSTNSYWENWHFDFGIDYKPNYDKDGGENRKQQPTEKNKKNSKWEESNVSVRTLNVSWLNVPSKSLTPPDYIKKAKFCAMWCVRNTYT